mgnify:CR=1 FL=1
MNLLEQLNRIKSIMGVVNESETQEGLLDNLRDFFQRKNKHNKLNDPDFLDQEKERFTCEDCGNPDYEMYMVNDDLWDKYGNDNKTLCLSCLEKRMGRKLTKDDFTDHENALVNKHNLKVQQILNK